MNRLLISSIAVLVLAATMLAVQGETALGALVTNVFPDDGPVGIGTTNPGVQGEQMEIRNDGSGQTSHLMLSNRAAPAEGNTSSIIFAPYSASYTARIDAIAENTGAATGFAFSTHTGGSFGEKVRIDNSGNVGVGTTDPDSRLHVGGLGGEIRLDAGGNSGSSQSKDFKFYVGGATKDWDSLDIYAEQTEDGNDFERLVSIRADGNIGIGTALPSDNWKFRLEKPIKEA